MEWWREARYGLFVHWGPVSLEGTEIGWSRQGKRPGTGGTGTVPVKVYDGLYKQFNPTEFNADEWVQLAKDAGMKYIVFTTKHHDGFVNFDSKLTDYKITSPKSPFRRDIVAELAAACHKAGLRLGFYYSPPDWHHPNYRTWLHALYISYLHGQLRELCTNYGQVDVIWFDGLGGKAKDWDAENLFRMMRSLQPDVLINNRAGFDADFDTPEQTVGQFNNQRPWESCITICQQWSWKPDDTMKTEKECLQTLVRCAGGDGNLLLNVGPMPTGKIEPRQADRLREIGRWLQQNGKSIYATRGGPIKPGQWGASTYRDNTIYLHVFDWGKAEQGLVLPAIPAKVLRSSLLTGGEVSVKQGDKEWVISVPPAARRDLDTVVVLELDRPAAEIKPVKVSSGSLAIGGKATASNVYQKMAEFGADKAIDDEDDTRWATDAGIHDAWLEVDMGRPVTINRAVVSEVIDRVQAYELQYKKGDEWRTCASGTKIGQDATFKFEPLTARFVRLVITKASDGPTLSEFPVVRAVNLVQCLMLIASDLVVQASSLHVCSQDGRTTKRPAGGPQ